MKRASISEAENGLTALIELVRQGASVIIEDRGVPVARLEPIVGEADSEGRLTRLDRQGRNANDIVLTERSEGRSPRNAGRRRSRS